MLEEYVLIGFPGYMGMPRVAILKIGDSEA